MSFEDPGAVRPYDFDERLRAGERGERFLDEHFHACFIILPVSQRGGYDRVFVDRRTRERWRVEYKTDATAARTHNLFVETVSVDVEGVPGWAYTSRADLLLHHIPEPEWTCYVVPFAALREQLPRWTREYPSRRIPNRGRGRPYHTVGLLVPQDEYEAIALAVVDTELASRPQPAGGTADCAGLNPGEIRGPSRRR